MRRGRPGGLACGPAHRKTGKRLFWRIFMHGLMLILLVGLAGLVVFHLFGQEGTRSEWDAAARYGAERIGELRSNPAALTAELERLHVEYGVMTTVYAEDGETVVASTAHPPMRSRVSEGSPRARTIPSRYGRAMAVPLAGGGQVIFAIAHPPAPAFPVVLLAVLGVIALFSVPLARSIAAPVERLTRAARALGAGDLSARARVQARGEVGELAQAFDEMAERIEAQVRAEKELLANVSHEVRTPLARIKVALELAAEGDLERARRYLGEIGADLDELDHLVEDVLSTARLDLAAHQGGDQVRREPVDLAAVAAEAARRFAERWPSRTLELDVPASLPGVSGDAALLRRLLENLLDNAAKYSEAPAPVRLVARGEAGAAVLEVRDRGMGIAPEDLQKLFTPFFRTDRSRARSTGGFGLGLALARRIARVHGGEIEVESQVEQGTVFRVRLPVTPAAARG